MSGKWYWEKPTPDYAGALGDVAKLIKNEHVDQPGALERQAPSQEATVFAREVIQNSWDAADDLRRQLRREHVKEGLPGLPDPPHFEVRFCFREARDSQKTDLVRELGLDELAYRLDRGVERKEIGLGQEDCLEVLGDPRAELPYMVIEEEAASGMYGPWVADKSKMYEALLSVGLTSGSKGKGGSYGFGKSGMVQGTAIRTVIAYSCFRSRPQELAVTRRLLGVAYWGRHDFGGESFTGWARFGKKGDGEVPRPFENEDADQVARQLGLEIRDPEVQGGLGTTFILIQPTMSPEDLVKAIERSWWPALEERSLQFGVTVFEASGTKLIPRPRRDPVLSTFVKAYEVATQSGEAAAMGEKKVPTDVGEIGLVSDVDGWSYAEQTGDLEDQQIVHRSLIARMRKPRMVVDYLPHPPIHVGGPPYVRGVFIAHEPINEQLRQTEPKLHTTWDWRGDAPGEAKKVAKRVHDRIQKAVRDYRKELKPPPRPPEQLHLPVFDALMRTLLSGSGHGPVVPPSGPRAFTIHPTTRLEPAGENEVRVTGEAEFGLSEHFNGMVAEIEVSIRYRFVEDDRVGDWAEIVVRPPTGFVEIDGKYQGRVRRHTPVTFTFETDAYESDWTGRLYAEAKILEPIERNEV